MEDVHGYGRAGARLRLLGSGAGLAQRGAPEAEVLAWISHSFRIANLTASGVTEVLPLFWVRLYGLLTEIADFVELNIDSAESRAALFPLARAGASDGQLRSALAALCASYQRDELLYIEYRRHVECHPLQTKYRSRRPRGVSGHVPSALLGGAPVTLEAAEAAFRRVLAAHGSDETAIGVQFARRAIAPLRELETLAKSCLWAT